MRTTNPKQYLRRLALPLFAAAIAVGIAACENPVQDGGDAHAVGIAVFSGSSKVADYIEAGNRVSGEITVPSGETRTFRVRMMTAGGGFRDIDGTEFSVSSPEVIVPNIATVSLLGADQLRITGQAVTQQAVTMTLRTHHGDHPEFTAEFRLRITQ